MPPLRDALGPGTTRVMDVLGLLLLQMEWGADEALEDAPVDRLPGAPRTQARELASALAAFARPADA